MLSGVGLEWVREGNIKMGPLSEPDLGFNAEGRCTLFESIKNDFPSRPRGSEIIRSPADGGKKDENILKKL